MSTVIEVRLVGKSYETLKFFDKGEIITYSLKKLRELEKEAGDLLKLLESTKGLRRGVLIYRLDRLAKKRYSRRENNEKLVLQMLKKSIEEHEKVSIHDQVTSEFRYLYSHEIPKITELLGEHGSMGFLLGKVVPRPISPNESRLGYSIYRLSVSTDALTNHGMNPLSELAA